jgi:hypothetical protein
VGLLNAVMAGGHVKDARHLGHLGHLVAQRVVDPARDMALEAVCPARTSRPRDPPPRRR